MAYPDALRAVLAGRWWALFLACAAAGLLPLPFGFIEADVAVVAAVWGLYFALPMAAAVLAAGLALWARPPRWVVRSGVILLGVPALLHFLYWGLWVGYLALALLAPAAVMGRAAYVAWRAA